MDFFFIQLLALPKDGVSTFACYVIIMHESVGALAHGLWASVWEGDDIHGRSGRC